MAAMAAVSARRMRGPRVTCCQLVLGEEGHLFGGPAAFGADGEGEWTGYIPPIAMRLR